MTLHAQRKYSFADYLTVEREADVRHEYVNGHVYDMVGATENHNIIVTNIVSELRFQMKARPCVVYASDMKVRIEAADAGKYPDVLINELMPGVARTKMSDFGMDPKDVYPHVRFVANLPRNGPTGRAFVQSTLHIEDYGLRARLKRFLAKASLGLVSSD